jgi:hypothetical protein
MHVGVGRKMAMVAWTIGRLGPRLVSVTGESWIRSTLTAR